ncbi:hypothetical protein HED60_04005 [Planctomycetales bacterium ZRK34]|nr:hypothetical protein HED60_04005 [Planctomycetales bacterium ZRK34]
MRMNQIFVTGLVGTFALTMAMVSSANAQTTQQRLAEVRRNQEIQQYIQEQKASGGRVSIALSRAVTDRQFGQLPARQAFDWLSTMTDLPIVINWNRLAEEGIDAEQEVTLPLGPQMTGQRALDMLVKQLGVDGNLLWEPSAWYVEVLTKSQANQRTIVRTYPIGDLLHTVPNFDNAPALELNAITEGGSSSSGGGGGGQDLFTKNDDEEKSMTKAEHAQRLAQIIRDTVEPDIWRANGGQYATITYWNEMLIIRAPAYVQRQIGAPGNVAAAPVNVAPAPALGEGVFLPNPQVGIVHQGAAADFTGVVDHTARYVNFTTGLSTSNVSQLRQVNPSVRTPASFNGRPYTRGTRDAGIAPKLIGR